jgi:hypothetical protein
MKKSQLLLLSGRGLRLLPDDAGYMSAAALRGKRMMPIAPSLQPIASKKGAADEGVGWRAARNVLRLMAHGCSSCLVERAALDN